MAGSITDVKSIFGRALEIASPAEREAYLTEACGDLRLRAEVESLLRAGEAAGGFFADLRPTPGPTIDQPVSERPGDVIGPYKLVEVIGEGGFGVVYLAEQQHPVRRRVALKVLKPGMDSKSVLARFEAERQALALMDHPNIAKVHDGGATAAGRPYFVMELVKGTPITRYCDDRMLTLRERLELFVPVCQAVQHAHQKGVIHRDLKPSNVLVAPYDEKPVPKVIDFGVAKAAGQPLTEKTLVTGLGAVVGTPAYMSPEQAQLNNLDVDTRSDVYSLGVLLYELLTGTTPLSSKRAEEAGLLEALRIIREEETPRPSARLSTVEELPAIAARRGVEPRKLSGLVRGELDWVVMKCLEKDRSRRYETADALAKDVVRFLADEPVQACPPSAAYRVRKFVRRNRLALAAASAVGVVVLLAVSLLGLGYARLDREQEETKNALAAVSQAKTDLQQSVDRERKNLYDYAFGMANRDWLAGNIDQARQNLEVCPPELRARDWRYLHRVCHSELLRINLYAQKLQYSPDGRYLAGAGTTIIVWDATTGQTHLDLGPEPTSRGFAGVGFHPERNELIWATTGVSVTRLLSRPSETQGKLGHFSAVVWDGVNRKRVAGFEREDSRGRAVLSPTGDRVILIAHRASFGAAPPPRLVSVCETRTGRELCQLAVPKDQQLVGAAFHPDGQVLTVSSDDMILRFWDVATGQQRHAFSLADFPLKMFALSPDGRRLAAVSHSDTITYQVKVWELQRGREIAALRGHSGQLRTLAFSPDGRRLATGGADKAVMIWDVDRQRELFTFRGHQTSISDIAYSPDGSRVASSEASSSGTVRVWDVSPFED